MIKAIIIEDEKMSRETLSAMLKRYCPDVEITHVADGFESGKKLLQEVQPDVLFLDIQMPDGNGFKILEDLQPITFDVIFTTAFDQFAIRAIKYCALDYLLKPISSEELIDAVNKVRNKNNAKNINNELKILLENIQTTKPENRKIVLNTAEGRHIVETGNIVRCESEDCYTRVFLSDKKVIMISKTLKEIEELLDDEKVFLRPHKSHLVNISYIKTYQRVDGGTILLKDGFHIPVSRRSREKIQDFLNHLH